MSMTRTFAKMITLCLDVMLALNLAACGTGAVVTAQTDGVAAVTAQAEDNVAETALSDDASNQISKVYTIKEISSFGNVVLDCSQEDMKEDGFAIGDLITLEYEEISLTVPIISDYVYDVTNTGGLVWYGERHPSFGSNCSNFVMDYGFVSDQVTAESLAGKTCTISMAEKGARKDYLESIELHMSNERQDYGSDLEYTNIYPVVGGALKEGVIYRGSSLFNNENNRVETAQAVVEELGIKHVIDLTMRPEDATPDSWEVSPYVRDLLKNDDVYFCKTGVNYKEGFAGDIAGAFRTMITLEKPVYINCQMGRDRTGMASILLLSAAGASYDEIRDNFMQTFCNYYKVKPGDAAYEAMQDGLFTIMMKIMTGVEEPSKLTPEELTGAAAEYLQAGGFTEEEFEALQVYCGK